jgi:hypothetical protein
MKPMNKKTKAILLVLPFSIIALVASIHIILTIPTYVFCWLMVCVGVVGSMIMFGIGLGMWTVICDKNDCEHNRNGHCNDSFAFVRPIRYNCYEKKKQG